MPFSAIKALLARRRARRQALARQADPIGAFIAEHTRPLEGSRVPSALIYREYDRWAEANGFPRRHPQALHRRLAAMGYRRIAANGIHWVGLDLLVEEPQ